MENLKTSNYAKIILIIFILLIIIALLFIFFKHNNNESILTKIGESAVDVKESKNYYYEVKSNSNPSNNFKIWVNNNKIAFQTSTQENSNYKTYVDLDKKETYIVNENSKTYSRTEYIPPIANSEGIFVNPPTVFSLAMHKVLNGENEEFKNMLNNIKITEENYNEQACYKITYFNNQITYFSKDSLLPIENIIGEEKLEYTIKKNCVDENNVTFSDIDSYKEENK